jgi:hypothetical protein
VLEAEEEPPLLHTGDDALLAEPPVLSKILIAFLTVAAVCADAAQLKSSFHLDLDDCDDVAADSSSLYFACHSTHAPGAIPANPPNMDAWVAKLDRITGKILYLTHLAEKASISPTVSKWTIAATPRSLALPDPVISRRLPMRGSASMEAVTATLC